jgi:putative membrane protein
MRIRSMAGVLFTSAIACAALAADPVRTAARDDDVAKFFEKAASAGKLEIETGKLATQRATEPELRDFGQMMVKDHTQADSELKALAAKKGVTVPMAMSRDHQKKLDALRAEKSGKDFDDEYRDLMIDSHDEAVDLFEDTARDSADPDVKAFAAKLLPKLQHHQSAANALPKM